MDIYQVSDEDKQNFIAKGQYALQIRKNVGEATDEESIFVHEKRDKKKHSIGIIKTDGTVSFISVKDKGPEGIWLQTDIDAQISTVDLSGKKMFFFTAE